MDEFDLSEDSSSNDSEEMDSLLLQAYTNTMPVNLISANSSFSTESGEIKELPLPQPIPAIPVLEHIVLNTENDDSESDEDTAKGKRTVSSRGN